MKNVLAFVIPFIGQVQGVISTSQLKILMGNLQINASLSVVFSIPWPPLHVRFINLMSIFKFDMFKFLAFASPCLHSNHFMSLAMFVAMPLVIAAVFFVTFAFVALCSCINRACCHCMRRLPCCKFTVGSAGTSALKLVIFIVLFIYPTICSKVFTTFKCDNVNGESFMVADMTVTCFAGEWLIWAGVSVGAMLLYVVGIPLGLCHRKVNHREHRKRASYGAVHAFSVAQQEQLRANVYYNCRPKAGASVRRLRGKRG